MVRQVIDLLGLPCGIEVAVLAAYDDHEDELIAWLPYDSVRDIELERFSQRLVIQYDNESHTTWTLSSIGLT